METTSTNLTPALHSRKQMAGFIDSLVFSMMNVVFNLLLSHLIGSDYHLMALTSYGLYSIFMVHIKGQTFGKTYAKIRVVSATTGELPSLKMAIIRKSGYLLAICIMYYVDRSSLFSSEAFNAYWILIVIELINAITGWLTPKKQNLFDLFAGTMTIDIRSQLREQRRQTIRKELHDKINNHE